MKILQAFQSSLRNENVYKSNEIEDVLKKVRTNFRFAYSNKKQKYFNVPCAFDIETSSFYYHGRKTAIMYEWTFGIFGEVIIGRSWGEFVDMLQKLSELLDLTIEKRLIIYVHNLSFEFQFMRKYFDWLKVFSIKSRTPIYALTNNFIEFRCSYLLSGYSLAKLGDQLQVFNIHKLTGDLDYDLIRHSKTVLSETELQYCINDVRVVMAYIMEKIQQDGNIAKIPITKTGYVRNYCRNNCFYEPDVSRSESFKRLHYRELMQSLVLDPEEYAQLKRAFQGGFTHANAFMANKIMYDVTSFDFTSSYPTVMISEKFPMSKGEIVPIKSVEELEKNLKLYCCVFDVQFSGLQSILWQENYISRSRCWSLIDGVVNNGRIVSAVKLCTTITEQDYLIIKKFYKWDKIKIANFRRYKKDYLPTDFVKSILKLYADKTTLKGVKGKEIEYLKSKEMLNSCYGMCVTDPVREQFLYTDHWLEKDEKPAVNMNESIEKYNKSPSRFLFYPWGVWVTAYARRNLFSGILECGSDYIYSDTDSIKIRNADKHKKYFEKYNARIISQLKTALDYHGIDHDAIEPKTIKGIKKPLGVWDFDGHYERFKTLGAKRYMIETETGVNITVAGLNKSKSVPILLDSWYYDLNKKCYVNDPFDRFTDELEIKKDYTGKMTHTYIDELRTGEITDYNGVKNAFYEKSGVHLEKAEYSLKLSAEYADYLMGIKEVEV